MQEYFLIPVGYCSWVVDMKKRNKDTLQPGWPVAPGCSPADPFGSYTGVPVEQFVLDEIHTFIGSAAVLDPEIGFRAEIVSREQIKSFLPWLPPQLIAIYSEKKDG